MRAPFLAHTLGCRKEMRVPLYMDRHEHEPTEDGEEIDVDRWARENVIEHAQDLEVQERYGVNYLTYWSDPTAGATFCLASGPSAEAVDAVHRASHGNVAGKIIEVDGDAVQAFIGKIVERPVDEPFVATAFRVILFTDIEESTSLNQRLGDARSMELLRFHDSTVRVALKAHEGSEVKHTGDGIMASFASVSAAVACAVDIQRGFARYNETADGERQLHVRIGISAGEPVTERNDLFGAAVQLAARLCDQATRDSICCSSVVRELAIGKGFAFDSRGAVQLKGFPDPVPLFEVRWLPD